MKGLGVLIRKEWRENARNFKLYWIPIVFIIFGILEPITNHFLPEIMKSVGNLPEGTEFTWPQLRGEDIFISLMGQYQLIGILIIILAFMGSISSERKSGTATLLYVRPMSFVSYFLSKWIVINGIVLGSVWLGFLAAWYYINILFNPVAAGDVFAFLVTYSLWIILAVTVVLSLSAWLSTGATAGLSILVLLVLQVIDSVIGAFWTVSPWKVGMYASMMFSSVSNQSGFWMSIGLTVALILLLITFGINMAKRNAAKTTV
ncbi:ABC transporter permease [Sporosarcina thermotolerans]|uniref:ABC transporter permease n=1 Tax=Sporosarcina thermotolerans TaxID=633404 RepID=A0AAW9AB59_9BACL|nr:ABC transporter permease subunit [Sporosarcina thermotolerans]MDW0118274.1 ABC transporter permease [Sporosarcina thermotolerans]WHT48588.1 ABC transporter permease [Sporosarcina thermotolerans]